MSWIRQSSELRTVEIEDDELEVRSLDAPRLGRRPKDDLNRWRLFWNRVPWIGAFLLAFTAANTTPASLPHTTSPIAAHEVAQPGVANAAIMQQNANKLVAAILRHHDAHRPFLGDITNEVPRTGRKRELLWQINAPVAFAPDSTGYYILWFSTHKVYDLRGASTDEVDWVQISEQIVDARGQGKVLFSLELQNTDEGWQLLAAAADRQSPYHASYQVPNAAANADTSPGAQSRLLPLAALSAFVVQGNQIISQAARGDAIDYPAVLPELVRVG